MSGPDPAVASVRHAVRADLADLADGALVLVACSGGPDSLALAAATAFEVGRAERACRGLRAGAVVVDHRWRPESAAVAARAGATCRALGLDPVEVVAADARTGTGGPEAAARAARYAVLDAAAGGHGAAAVLLGHTLDDQAETVLLGLARGSGARSLAGMAARRGRYRRPLLDLTRATTVAACAALGLTPWNDPANVDPSYARSRVRAAMDVLGQALGPGLPAALARTATQLAEDADALDGYAADLLAAARLGTAVPDGLTLDAGSLGRGPAAVRRRALLLALRAAGCPAGALGRRHVLAVDALVVAWRGQGPVHLPAAVVASRDCGRLTVARPEGAPARVGDGPIDDAGTRADDTRE
jgi:tRNA(Ile)-lysidine synthase